MLISLSSRLEYFKEICQCYLMIFNFCSTRTSVFFLHIYNKFLNSLTCLRFIHNQVEFAIKYSKLDFAISIISNLSLSRFETSSNVMSHDDPDKLLNEWLGELDTLIGVSMKKNSLNSCLPSIKFQPPAVKKHKNFFF